MTFIKDLLKDIGDEHATLAADIVETETYVDSGSFIFNALVSGSIRGGISGNKITAIAGESSTGKTFFALAVVKNFLDSDPNAIVVYYDTESAITRSLLEERDIDTSRVIVMNIVTIEAFRTKALQCVDKYLKIEEEDRQPMLFVLDSLGMLSTEKEMTDTAEGKLTKDMTRAQLVKATFRVLTMKLGKAGIPLIMTNHTYDVVGSMFPQKTMGGGSGLKYAASSIIYLSKKKEKDGTEVIGNIVHCKNHKSRLTVENKMVDVRLSYSGGLDKHYGLLDLALKHGIFKSVSTRIELPDGTKTFGKTINNDPEKYFTEEIMEKLEEAADKEFKYG